MEYNRDDIISHNNNCDRLRDITFGLVNFDSFKKGNSIKIYTKSDKASATVEIIPENIKATNDTFKKKLENKVRKFVATMSNKCPNTDLSYFKENFRTAEFDLNDINSESELQGKYNVIRNKIQLYTFSSAYHELMHMASRHEDDSYVYNGFQVYWNSKQSKIAEFFNEGYTQLLTEKYFGEEKGFYELLVDIASQIEELVGEDKMEQLYFKGDLLGLINELEKYETKTNIVRFLYALDKIERLQELSMFTISEASMDKIESELDYIINEDVVKFINNCWENKNDNQDISKLVA